MIASSQENTHPPLPLHPTHRGGVGRRVCLATQEVNGPFRNGGIGTAYTTLAESLARRRHRVTLLFLRGDYCESQSMDYWISHYAEKGIELVPLPSERSLRLHGPGEAATSYRAYRWLRERATELDVVHFPELGGSGFYSLLAKRQGLAFSQTTLCIGTHSPMFWIRESNGEYLNGVSDLEMDFMERQSVEMADVVVSPSHYMLSWMTHNGWKLPDASFVQQNILPGSARADRDDSTESLRSVEEVVFFGRLETRKGLELFVEAFDRLADLKLASLKTITFMGRPALVRGRDSEAYLASAVRRWPWPTRTLTHLGQVEAMRYLREPGTSRRDPVLRREFSLHRARMPRRRDTVSRRLRGRDFRADRLGGARACVLRARAGRARRQARTRAA